MSKLGLRQQYRLNWRVEFAVPQSALCGPCRRASGAVWRISTYSSQKVDPAVVDASIVWFAQVEQVNEVETAAEALLRSCHLQPWQIPI